MDTLHGICAPGFERHLEPFHVLREGGLRELAYGVWPDLTLAYFNQGWIDFAQANQGDPRLVTPEYLGTSVVDVCATGLRTFYRDLFTKALAQGEGDALPSTIQFLCPSPELHREFAMTIYPLAGQSGLLIVTTLVAERPHEQGAAKASADDFIDPSDIVTQCAHCRRFRRADDMDAWEWVPAWINEPPALTSHGLCALCLDHFYPQEAGSPS